jgi:hypothetical protein
MIQQQQQQQQQFVQQLQASTTRTNIYISGLRATTVDDDLRALCQTYGNIISAKAMIDHNTGQCKGYGFVMFEREASARLAIEALSRKGIQVTFARNTGNPTEFLKRRELDPTNLYVTGIPQEFDEAKLTELLLNYMSVPGEVLSCRVLRDENGVGSRVGMARLDSSSACESIIKNLDNTIPFGLVDPVRVKHANGPSPKAFQCVNQARRRKDVTSLDGQMFDMHGLGTSSSTSSLGWNTFKPTSSGSQSRQSPVFGQHSAHPSLSHSGMISPTNISPPLSAPPQMSSTAWLDDVFRPSTASSFQFGGAAAGKQEQNMGIFERRTPVEKPTSSSASISTASTPFPNAGQTAFDWTDFKASIPTFPSM